MTEAHHPLRFELRRNETPQGHDVVAVGAQFADGTVVLRWLGDHPSTAVYADWADVMRVHHVGEPRSKQWTTAEWLDGVCFACGAEVAARGVFCGGNGTQCCGCSSTWDGPPSREVGGGMWRSVGTLPARDSEEAAQP